MEERQVLGVIKVEMQEAPWGELIEVKREVEDIAEDMHIKSEPVEQVADTTNDGFPSEFVDFDWTRLDFVANKMSGENTDTIFECKICNAAFTTKTLLKDHGKLHKNNLVCTICGSKYRFKSLYDRHMITHTGKRIFECNFCSTKFTQKGHMLSHMTLHTGEKRFSCDRCPKKFATKSHLLIHLKSHTGEKAHACSFCAKSFAQKCTLDRHIRTHTDERNFVCNFCNRAFNEKTTLVNHIRVHKGEKNYVCGICDRAFVQRGGLLGHMKTHEHRQTYACASCHKTYSSKNCLRRHTREVHEGVVEKPSYSLRSTRNIKNEMSYNKEEDSERVQNKHLDQKGSDHQEGEEDCQEKEAGERSVETNSLKDSNDHKDQMNLSTAFTQT